MARSVRTKLVGAAGAAVLLVGGGLAYVYASGGSGEASAEIVAPVLDDEPTGESSETPSEAVTEAAQPDGTYAVAQEQSEARYELDEVLRGEPKHVVGTTSEVAALVRFDIDDPSVTELGDILVNVRTLETDSGFRDRASRGQILESAQDEFEFMTIAPTDVAGIPEAWEVGATYNLTVAAAVTLHGITATETFDVALTIASPDRLEVLATTTVLRATYDLTIPNVRSVADVSEEVVLTANLVLLAV